MKVFLYRNKEPESGLDVSKGFKIGFFDDDNPWAEVAEMEFWICEDNENESAVAPDTLTPLDLGIPCQKCGRTDDWVCNCCR